MHVNVDYAVRAARTGNPSMLVSLLRGYFHGTADLGMSVLEAQSFIRGFPKEWAAATEDEPILAAASTKTTGSQAAETYARRAAEREARATPSPSEKAAPVTSTWDDILLSRRLGLNAAAPEPAVESASATAAWDEVIAMVNKRYFNSVATNRDHPNADG